MIELVDFKVKADFRAAALHEVPNEDSESFAVDA
jgi:hypothetical protein